jgi:transposase
MWHPPIALPPEEQQMVARTRKTRKFFVFLRERRHEILDTDLQNTLAQSYSPEPGGQAPVEPGLLALATLLQAYCNVGDRDAVELTVMDKRWQMVLDCLGAEQPPCSQSTLCNVRMRSRACTFLHVLGRTVARFLARMISRWTLWVCR